MSPPAVLLAVSALLAQSGAQLPSGTVIERVSCQRDATQTYALYLPRAYDPARRWPALLVFDPRGRAVTALELFREAAERHGWIVLSSHDTRSDGPPEPNRKALDAMWPEIHLRFATDPRRIYAAGFSGGAHLAWALGKQPGRLAGAICSGGRFIPELLPDAPDYASFEAAGDTDFNYQGTREVDAALAARGAVHRLEIFAGQHQWMPAELAGEAVEWMELQAMRRGLRERSPQVVEAALAADVEAARRLEADGAVLAAVRRWQAIAHGFEGLADTTEALGAAARLAALPACTTARREEARWDTFEAQQDVRLGEAVGELRNPDRPVTSRRLMSLLDVRALQEIERQGGVGGTTARRVLNRIYTQTAFYLPGELLAAAALPQAIAVLEVASEIRPDEPTVWYNLACARARAGKTGKALDALEAAVGRGFSDAKSMASDPDLASLRTNERFKAIVTRLQPAAATQSP